MRVIFLIQGEGNGHLTQAISMYQMLSREGHEVIAAMIGSLHGNKKPEFFTRSVNCPIHTFKSVGLAYSNKGRLSVSATLLHLLRSLPVLSRSLKQIHEVVKKNEPDLIVNFYEIGGGLYNLCYGNTIPVVCLAHQYLFLHPDFRFPRGKQLHRLGLTLLNKITSYKASRIYALSFTERYRSTDRMEVVPPLLRAEVSRLTPTSGKHLLVYLTQPLLRHQIEKWHRRNPSIIIHCFCNNPLQKTTQRVGDNLFFHPNDTTTFLNLLETCKAFATTSGFESVCEAMYLGKPVLLVPVPNHYEQECNALDAVLNEAGISDINFNLDHLLSYTLQHTPKTPETRRWFDKKEELILDSMVGLISTRVHASV